MDSYSKMYAEAEKAKSLGRLTPDYRKFDAEGDRIVGEYLSQSHVQGEEGGKGYNQYLFETDEGPVKFHMGSAADSEFQDQFKTGHIYAVVFQGKESIRGGRTVNKFDVFLVGHISDLPPADSKSKASGTADDKK